MSTKLQFVPLEYASQTWPLVEAHIASMAEFGPVDHTLDQMKMQVCMGNWQLMVVTDEEENIVGAGTIAYQQYPNDKIAFITSVGGKGLLTPKIYKELTEFVKSKGATRVQAYARPSVSRLARRCGMNEVAVLLDAPI